MWLRRSAELAIVTRFAGVLLACDFGIHDHKVCGTLRNPACGVRTDKGFSNSVDDAGAA
jgi:hypothetical protein